jgi:RsiW-degrading membrane proteinase PrsW (M82 family)
MPTNKNAFKTILLSGLIAGSLDILAACTSFYLRTGKGPGNVLRFVASGIFGKAALTDNTTIMWMGLLFHFIIAFAFTVVFFIIYPKVKFLHINIILTAVIFGMVAWLVMNLIVVPLSNTAKYPFDVINTIKGMLILICMIGLPLSIIFKRYFKNYNRRSQP